MAVYRFMTLLGILGGSAKGLAQAELASELAVSRQTINSIETGRYTPSLPLAIAIARFFGTSVEEIFHADHD